MKNTFPALSLSLVLCALLSPSFGQGRSVTYRGAFINDEDWCLAPWCEARFGKERGICVEAYREIFADMKARNLNLLWPAMHPGGYEFCSRKENLDAARDAGITIGTSHCEPMLRNNCYWKKEQGVWDYRENKAGIDAYWQWAVDTYGDYDCLWTIGIRGIHDAGMRGPRDPRARIAILENVFDAQTKMLGPKRPMVFCPYKEVLPLYDAGLKVPDAATLLWVDDNFGYIRRLGGPKAAGKKQGIYWHASYFGTPHSYTHVCTIPPAFMWYQLVARCWGNGVCDLWMMNVGDYYPADFPLYALGRLGADPEAWDETAHDKLLTGYVESLGFSGEVVPALTGVLDEYYRLGWIRKPELMCANWTKALTVAERADLRRAYVALLARYESVVATLPKGQIRERFEALQGYQIRFLCEAGVYFMDWGDAADDIPARTALAERMRTRLVALEQAVEPMEGGHWKGFWWSTASETGPRTRRFSRGGKNGWASQMQWPWNEPADQRPGFICTVAQADPYLAAAKLQSAAACVKNEPANGGAWKRVKGLGNSYEAMALLPVKPGVGQGASLTYELTAAEDEKALVLQFLPDIRLYPGEKLRVKVSVNGAELVEVEVPGSTGREDENGGTRRYAVQDGFVRAAVKDVLKPGINRVVVTALDAGVVLDKIGVR